MINNFFKFLIGEVSFYVEGGDYSKFLNLCMEDNLDIKNIIYEEIGFKGNISARNYKKLHSKARICKCKLKCVNKYGVPFIYYKMRKRVAIPIGLIFLVIAPIIYQNVIWSIKYYNIDYEQSEKIKESLYEYGIYPGALLKPQEVEIAKNNLILSHPEYSWLSINNSRGQIIIEAQTATIPTKDLEDGKKIIASSDGIIVEMELYSGFSDLTIGQSVSKGDILINNEKFVYDRTSEYDPTPLPTGRLFTSNVNGKIIARINKEYSVSQSLNYESKVATGEMINTYSLNFPFIEIPLFEKIFTKKVQNWSDYTVAKSTKHISIMGFSLPITLITTKYTKNETQSIHLTQTQSFNLCKYKIIKTIKKEFPELEILDDSYKTEINDNIMTVNYAFTANANISQYEY